MTTTTSSTLAFTAAAHGTFGGSASYANDSKQFHPPSNPRNRAETRPMRAAQ